LVLAQAEPKVRTEPWLRPNEKFDFTFWLISGLTWFYAQSKGSATDWAKKWSYPVCSKKGRHQTRGSISVKF